MKRFHWIILVVTLSLLDCTGLTAASRDEDTRPAGANQTARVQLLAADVREIASSSGLSHAKKEKRIATTVRVAVVAATAYRHNPGEVLEIALELTSAAARAAPAYVDVISNAVSFAPPLARIDGASGQVRATAMAAAKGRRFKPAVATAAAEPARRRPARPVEMAEEPPPPAAQAQMDDEAPDTTPVHRHHARATRAAMADSDNAESTAEPAPSSSRGFSLGDNSSVHVSATVGARHDDNIFLSKTDKVGDTILSLAPAAEFHFGQSSQAKGSLSYQESFERYTGKSAPNVSLGTGAGDFSYDDGELAAVLNGSYQQLYESSPNVLVVGRSELVRNNQLGIGGSVEAQVGSKMSVKGGADLNNTEYLTPGFINRNYVSLPLDVFFKVTPKVDLSAGYTYGVESPGGGGPRARDNYFNLGARGEFTPKLTGSFSAGYQTRSVAGFPKDHLLAFTGAFDYEVTTKTKATLSATRNFNASATGQSTKNSSYSLGVTSMLSPQWQLGAALNYQDNAYGPAVFNLGAAPFAAERTDRYWVGNFFVSYLYSEWLSTNASYSLRNNHSTIEPLGFSDNIFSLSIGLKY